jgi:ATP-dependent DNA helicase DinG
VNPLEELFSPSGRLAEKLPSFRPRASQIEMAKAIADVMQTGGTLIAEAGTGTGKTLAYLVPALLSGKRVIISTATKTLQDQLFMKDLPLVRRALPQPIKTALLKGRGNYLCLYRQRTMLHPRSGHDAREASHLMAINRWAKSTRSGDIAEVKSVPENSALWPSATSTADNCLGQECPQFSDCFLTKARNQAREANIVVINHHLLWADWTLRDGGYGELLPEADVIIVDEAHHFPESATQFLGTTVSSRQLHELANDIEIERLKSAPDDVSLPEEVDRLERLVHDARLALGLDARREPWHQVAGLDAVNESFHAIREQLQFLADALKPLSIRGKGLESCQKRAADLLDRLQSFLSGDTNGYIRWFETRKRGFSISRTPLEIASEFRKFRTVLESAWVFTSATLTVAGDFGHFQRQLGLDEAYCHAWESPFDYRSHCLLYLPSGLPDPRDMAFPRMMLDAVLPVLRASKGRAFMLFTSHMALNHAARVLAEALDYPLFVQGTQPKTTLLDAFKSSGHGILLGTSSFWEGVDVPGPSLSCVIIDKLPFASPTDPILSARLDHLRKAGLNPFTSFQLPAAIIALKQGVGRLIRDHNDRGVLMICDPRIRTKPYGKLFLKSLPDLPQTGSILDVQHFYDRESAEEAVCP